MSALEPGLYRATVRGVADVIVMVQDSYAYYGITVDKIDGFFGHEVQDITDARPLIVLDLEGQNRRYLIGDLRIAHLRTHNAGLALIADQIEAQTKPARIEEPGLWGVVEASVRGSRVRMTLIKVLDDETLCWIDLEDAAGVDWDDLTDPTLIRNGIES